MQGVFTRVYLFLLAQAIALALTLVACASQAPRGGPRPAQFELRLAEESPGAGLMEAAVGGGDKKVYLFKEAIITNNDLVDARVVDDGAFIDQNERASSGFSIHVLFTEEGAQKMSRATGAHLGKPIAILVDGKVVSARIVRSVISDRAAISGVFTREEAERLVSRIMSR